MESWQRRSPLAVLLIVAYVSVLPLLARLPHGPATGGQYVDTRDGLLSGTFLLELAYLSVFSSLAAPPLVVAWKRRETRRVTCVVSFVLTTLLLLFWHYGVNTQEKYGHVELVIIPIKTAVITSVVMLIVGLFEESRRNKQRPSPPLSGRHGWSRPQAGPRTPK